MGAYHTIRPYFDILCQLSSGIYDSSWVYLRHARILAFSALHFKKNVGMSARFFRRVRRFPCGFILYETHNEYITCAGRQSANVHETHRERRARFACCTSITN